MNDKINLELTEDEDLVRAKAWWKENGTSIVGGVLIGTALVFGYNYWQTYQEDQQREVAQLYTDYSRATDDKAILSTLLEVNDSAAYAQLARLKAAKVAADAGEYDSAEQLFSSVIASKADSGLRYIAALRLATVYLANDKSDDALALLEKNSNPDIPLMQARIDELMGDIYFQQGEAEKARSRYESALSLFSNTRQPLQLIQMKLDNL